MAYFSIVKGSYKSRDAIFNLIRYITNPMKNPYCISNRTHACNADAYKTAKYFENVQIYWRKENGKRIRHFHLDFSPNEPLNYSDLNYIGYKIIDYFANYQIVFALHEFDNDGLPCHKHLHFALNPINYHTGKRYRLNKRQLVKLRLFIEQILFEYGITFEGFRETRSPILPDNIAPYAIQH